MESEPTDFRVTLFQSSFCLASSLCLQPPSIKIFFAGGSNWNNFLISRSIERSQVETRFGIFLIRESRCGLSFTNV